jgi:rSAM/selenodomain-associated transferase 1
VLVFAKYPEEGQVKTRLAAHLGTAVAVEAYRNFVLDILSTVDELDVQTFLCFYPPKRRESFLQWLGGHRHYMEQEGKDLGHRMKNCFSRAFEDGFRRAVLIGTDSPDLPAPLIGEALSSLKTSHVTLGPSRDGGYYLIGFRHDALLPAAFDGISWGSTEVFRETLEILEKAGLAVHILREWRDIDTIEDVRQLIHRNRNTRFSSSKTIAYLSRHIDAHT